MLPGNMAQTIYIAIMGQCFTRGKCVLSPLQPACESSSHLSLRWLFTFSMTRLISVIV